MLTFTALLFLTGYILQQQTVRSLQSVILPRLPHPQSAINPSPEERAVVALEFGDPEPGSFSTDIYDDDWSSAEGDGR